MKKLLERAGFVNVIKVEPKKGRLPDLEVLENYDITTDKFRKYAMYVEAEKP